MKRTLHLVRPEHAPDLPLAAGDTVVYIENAGYAEQTPEGQRQPIAPHELIQHIFAADLVITW